VSSSSIWMTKRKALVLSKIGYLDGWELFLSKSCSYNLGLDVNKET
jgi:hypothetical protein